MKKKIHKIKNKIYTSRPRITEQFGQEYFLMENVIGVCRAFFYHWALTVLFEDENRQGLVSFRERDKG